MGLATAPSQRPAGSLEVPRELELIQSHMAQKPVLRGEVGCACVAREVSAERGGMGIYGSLLAPTLVLLMQRTTSRQNPPAGVNSQGEWSSVLYDSRAAIRRRRRLCPVITPPEATYTGPSFNRGSGGGARGNGFEERVGAYRGGLFPIAHDVCLSVGVCVSVCVGVSPP